MKMDGVFIVRGFYRTSWLFSEVAKGKSDIKSVVAQCLVLPTNLAPFANGSGAKSAAPTNVWIEHAIQFLCRVIRPICDVPGKTPTESLCHPPAGEERGCALT